MMHPQARTARKKAAVPAAARPINSQEGRECQVEEAKTTQVRGVAQRARERDT